MDQILLIDDNRAYCEQVKKTLALHNLELHYFTDAETGNEAILEGNWGAVLLDVILNQHLDGMGILKNIVETKPYLPVIMISGASTLQTAVEATRMGAYDFLEKPLDIDRLLLTIRRALEKNKLTAIQQSLYNEISHQIQLIGKSEAIQKIFKEIDRVAATGTKIFLRGESGTGKDLIARLIHIRSDRKSFPMISVSCGAIPQNLLETELFGYEKGAFTGANESRRGLIAQAEGGTLYLDDITELSTSSQAKLLKFLNDGQYLPVGSSGIVQADVRIIASSNKDIDREINERRFREDLYYRLNVVKLYIPPLRERISDIDPLAEFFLRRGCQKFHKKITHFSPEALELIKSQKWLGNVRQLKSAVYRMVLFAGANVIDYGTAATAIQMDRTNEMIIAADSYDKALFEFEKLYFLSMLSTNQWELSSVARAAGLNTVQLAEKLRHLGLDHFQKQTVEPKVN